MPNFDPFLLASAKVDAKRLSAKQREALLTGGTRNVYCYDNRTANALENKGILIGTRLTDKGRAVQYIVSVQQTGMGREEFIARQDAKRKGRELRQIAQRVNRMKRLSEVLAPIMA